MKPRILLIGKSGQLGTELNRLLPEVGEVAAPERAELDLRDPDKILGVLRTLRPQMIVNAAAYTAVDAAESDEDSAYVINAEAPRLLAEEAKRTGAALVHYSTDYVFDGAKKTPYLETDATNPLNAYGRTKLLGEQAIRGSGVSHLIFRTAWVYSTQGRNFLLTILRLATEREELRIVRDQTGSPTCALDLAEATAGILTGMLAKTRGRFNVARVSGVYHMTAAGQTTWFDFARAILEEANHAGPNLPWLAAATKGLPLICTRVLPITTEEFRSPTHRPRYSLLSNAHLNEAFGVTLPDWRAQLQRCFSSECSSATSASVFPSS